MTGDLLSSSFSLPTLASEQTHVWLVCLQQPDPVARSIAECLSREERENGARFHGEDNQRRYLVSHGVARLLLGRYTGREPALLEFSTGPFGKPFVDQPSSDSALHFNLSHTPEIAAVAISRVGPIGIDVERLRATTDIPRLVKRYFSEDEVVRFGQVEFEQHTPWFFRMWTCKEAVSKALGCGLSEPVSRFTVPDGELEDTVQVSAASKLAANETWYVTGFRYGADYVGALATPATNLPRIRIFTLAAGLRLSG
jgi:4'-phosphopantetheinyl transferase